eukprot:TRINITY_DN37910_c0_g1_i1.p2 TRINITY_DN37910_c0_g1~~TRINITY_DN37910_c0_g1_i1.p2  ORF type:complete len:170 (+),score=9.08 TRINITY_DN37910_c0_g1_i1:80-589(+)
MAFDVTGPRPSSAGLPSTDHFQGTWGSNRTRILDRPSSQGSVRFDQTLYRGALCRPTSASSSAATQGRAREAAIVARSRTLRSQSAPIPAKGIANAYGSCRPELRPELVGSTPLRKKRDPRNFERLQQTVRRCIERVVLADMDESVVAPEQWLKQLRQALRELETLGRR